MISETPIDYQHVYENILAETSVVTGKEYFRAISRKLCQSLGTWGSWITEYIPEKQKMVALAFFGAGKFIDHYEYELEGTPCQPVIEQGKSFHVGDELMEVFPKQDFLRQMGAMSYIGCPLNQSRTGNPIGLIGMMDIKPLYDRTKISLFELFAERAAAELDRYITQRDINAREEQMSLLLNSTMDGIFLLDEEFRVKRTNPAAARIFNCKQSDLYKNTVLERIWKEDRSAFKSIVESLKESSSHDSIWLPNKLKSLKADGSAFMTEATISHLQIGSETHYCLILRDMNDALESESRLQELTRERQVLRESMLNRDQGIQIIGDSVAMLHLKDRIQRVANTDSTVLINGETGSGKELVARSIHALSDRSENPLVSLNCAALPENLIESELFGHEKGAFTGANTSRDGRFAQADGGTLFLDEIGELPLEAQAKLLRVLQEGEFERLGSSKTMMVNVRIFAATNRDLKSMVDKGEFRNDLYYRLNVFPIQIPPLRERGNDITDIAKSIVEDISLSMGRRIPTLDDHALEILKQYSWPGNVRELKNTLERALIVCEGDTLILDNLVPATGQLSPVSDNSDRIMTSDELKQLEKGNIESALLKCDGRISGEKGAAALLGLKRTTLSSRIRALGISI